MGFLSTLFDIIVEEAEYKAKKFDRMSDEKIEKEYISKNPDKSVSDYREFSAKAHELHEYSKRRKNLPRE